MFIVGGAKRYKQERTLYLKQVVAMAQALRTGLAYDSFMTKHQNVVNPNHPETAERVSEPWRVLQENGLVDRCTCVECRPVTDEEIMRVHSGDHLAVLSLTKHLSQDEINQIALCYNSVFLNEHSFAVARLAAGCVLALTEAVVSGEVNNGMAVVRPPGHHAETTICMGFCLLNSVAIAAQHAVDKLGLSRVLVVDWDIHHGNGTQKHFYEDDRVLYFSFHRHDDGEFFPCKEDANFDYIGSGNGTGYNMNVAWNWDSMGDAEYMLACQHLLIPIATEFEPELILVSCGFDAGEGDFIGGYIVTPTCFAHMTRQLMGVANGKVVLALEGGYSISCITNSTSAVVSALLGDTPLPSLDLTDPSPSAVKSILSTGRALADYWKMLAIFREGADIKCESSPAAAGDTLESGRVPPSYGRSLPTMDLGEVISKLKSEIDAQDECPGSAEMSPQAHQDNSSQDLGSSDVKPPAATVPSPSPPGGVAQDPSPSPPGGGAQDPSPSGGGSQASSTSRGTANRQAAGIGTSTQQKIIQTLAQEGHDSMFAVSPKLWCEHLAGHVKPLPQGGIDSSLPCETCETTQEAWICLNCYHTFCGRYVNEHMVMHQESAGHKIALSMADLSVWCYMCDSYLDNHVLRPAINSAHRNKFGCNIDGTTS